MAIVITVRLSSTGDDVDASLHLRAHELLPDGPLVTADDFRAFIAAWRRNDPNGTFGSVTECGGQLHHTYYEDDPDVFGQFGSARDGTALYLISGFAEWTQTPDL